LRYVDYGLARHTRYWYRLTAHNSQGSDSPQTVQAETAAASVTIGEDWVEGEIVQTVIDYRYDALYHLTEANYSDGTFFHYTYDSNGNRVSETTEVGTVESVYDSANRLTSVGGVAYTWDANGNLLSDRVPTYTYNYANRLTGMTQGTNATGISYNGLGDRVSETVNGVTTTFTLDLNTGLTQVLADGTNTYLYGSGRICQFTGVESAYFLGDALGSVRQLADGTGVVTMASDYQPYGEKMSSIGSEETTYGYTGEWHDASTNLLYLRTRYYGSEIGRFLTRDTWEGSNYKPTSYNAWLYGNSNPILFTDPNGKCADTDGDNVCDVFPPYLNYHPRIDPLSRGASGIKPGQYQAQFINNTANQWKSKKTQNYPVSKNLCGQVSIAAILASVNSNITVFDVLDDYEEGYKNVASGSKTSDSELQGLIRRFYSDYLSTTNFPGLSNNVDRLIQNPNKDKWWSLSGRKETIETMKTFIGSVFIAGVFINGTSGTIGYKYNEPHWVVMTGI
jgi:RHS repeat-associated protein